MNRRTLFLGAAVVLAWFLYFNWDGVHTRFGADEMMNLADAWRQGLWRLFYSHLLLWRDFYRPAGGLFYTSLFLRFGLNPFPFHVALLALLLLNAALVYRLGRALGAAPLAAWIASLIVAYHAGLQNLYWDTAHVYDVLCSIFFAGALIVYTRARAEKRPLRPGEIVVFFALFLGALNSKEMALTLPLVLIAYEWFYRPPRRSWIVPAVAAGLCGVAAWGRVIRGLVHASGYDTAAPTSRFLEFQRKAWRDLLLWPRDVDLLVPAVAWIVLTYLAFRRDRPILRFCWAFLLITPLPVEFLQGRGQAVLAIPLIGGAIFAAVVFVDAASAAAGALHSEPIFRWLGRNGRLAAIVAVGLAFLALRNRDLEQAGIKWREENGGRTAASVIEQFREINPRVRPRSTVVFLNDPFEGFDMSQIAELWFRDRTLNIKLQRHAPLDDHDLARAEYVFDWRDGKLLLVRQP